MHWVQRIDDDSLQIVAWTSLGAVPVDANGAWLRQQIFELLPVTQATVVQASSHVRGRPTGQLGGRRRAQAR